ncbi:Kinesin-like protein KIF18A [Histomonas meleagridis]|uniref:Kinesin-like protein KIF18A n=1 Tax=Histomonas meleagridis TaxID=135588 RepID=UPI00355A28DC|nr:Kinesin-like protein KIF18A [Histomonas meleagridis]KAH0803496.1 Kinesin-like protein KIF18A [Histomonas meleagridis]
MALRSRTAPSATRDAGTRITVVVRVRPQNQRELSAVQGSLIDVVDDRVLIFDPPGERTRKQTFLQTSQSRAKNLHFGFDKVLGPNSTQEDVFEVVKNAIFPERGGLLDGINCTVFAYGATGSGKTFSMAGNSENPGIMARSVECIFTTLEQQGGRRPKLKMSYLEIYNEQIRDLLKPSDDPSKELKIVEDPKKGISVTGLSFCYPESTEEVLELIQIGNNRRTQAQTESNPVSSRSHAVCQIEVENCDDLPGVSSSHPVGKLSLIDLAGSERATSNTGIRLRESAKINCSLLALSNCINALCTQSSFIPFRQSKLTRLLKDSLGGNCKTVCLSCVSSSYLTYDDTFSTLQYANKTKNIRTNVTRNTLNVKARISQYPKMIAELREQIQILQAQGGNMAVVETFQKSIQQPFVNHKNALQTMLDQELHSVQSENDTKQQLLALQRISNSDFNSQIDNKIKQFVAECGKRRPKTSSSMVETVERMKILELENLALKGKLQIAQQQISLQQNVIRNLNQNSNEESIPVPPITISVPPKPVKEEETTKQTPVEPVTENEDKNEDTTITDIEHTITSRYPFVPVSARKTTFSADANRPVTPAGEATRILKQKFQEAQRMHMEIRKPLETKLGNGNIMPTSGLSKPPIRSLMDQLSQRVAAVNMNMPTNEEPTGILLSSRLLTRIGR